MDTVQDRNRLGREHSADTRRSEQFTEMAQQPVPGHVRGGMHIRRHHGTSGSVVERRHHLHGAVAQTCVDDTPLDAGRHDAGPQRLRQHEAVPGARSGVRHQVVRLDDSGDGKAVLGFRVIDRVATHQRASRQLEHRDAAGHHLLQDRKRNRVARPAHQLESRQRVSSHRVHVGGGDSPPVVRFVHHRREEVHGLNERVATGGHEYPAVVGVLQSDDEVGVASRR